jgi:hypothetical protein
MSDSELIDRQTLLQAVGKEVLGSLDVLFEGLAAPIPTGSYVSGLMAWPELDVMVLGGPDFSPQDVVALLGRVVSLRGVTGFDYLDERGDRSPTGERRDERYHVNIRLAEWRVDLSIWLYDDHINVTEWHRALAARITDDERLAVLRIKDVWHRRPEYPDEVSGLEIYTAVLDHGVRTPEGFGVWLAGSADPDGLGDAGDSVRVEGEEHPVTG